MSSFTYVVKNQKGKEFKGEVAASSKDDLRNLFLEKGFIPIEIIEKTAMNDLSQISIFKKKVKLKYCYFATR